VTSLTAHANSPMIFTRPPSLRVATSPDTARRASPTWTQTRAVTDNMRRRQRRLAVLTDDGTRLACTDYGDPAAAHTVVFLHGLCLDSTSWTRHIDQLTRRYGPAVRIISYDHRGHGHSAAAPASSYTISRLASDLSDVLRALHVHGPLTLVGHSMGGMTALAYLDQRAHLRPVEPTGLVLIATAAGKLAQRGLGRLLAAPGAATVLHRATQAPEKLLSTFVKPLCTLLSHLGDHLAATTLASVTLNALTTTPPRTALGFLPALRTYNLYPTLPKISAQTVILSGDVDPLTPAEHSRDLAATIPGARHITVAGAGHMLPQQAPDVILRAITDVITASARQRSAAADEPAALHHLAQQLAWFDDRASDPRYLNDFVNADIAGSIEAIFQQWLSLEADSGARSGINPLVSGLVSTPKAADLND
jgi:pimeloyl-ACP methyl ester carboxylesterase